MRLSTARLLSLHGARFASLEAKRAIHAECCRIRENARSKLSAVGLGTLMLKLFASYGIAKLLGGGIFLAIIIYILMSMFR